MARRQSDGGLRMRTSPHTPLGLAAALGTLAVDQGFKLWAILVYEIEARGTVVVTPFLDLVMAWNLGISYGLFQQEGALGRWILIAIKVTAVILFTGWLARAESKRLAVGLGLIIGGALGNGIDRVLWGAVADFFAFHVGTFHWYVFNLADVAIVVGVALLLYDGLVGSAAKSPASSGE